MRMKTGLLIPLIFLIACSGHVKEEKTEKFKLNETIMKMIAFDTAKSLAVQEEIQLIGKVSIDEEKVVHIFPLVSGYVTEVKVELGDYVNTGEILAVIKSTEMAGAENELTTAQSNLAIAQKNFSATEDMYKGGIVSEKDYIASQKEFQKAEAALKRAKDIISIYGGTDDKSEYVIKSPVSGYIVSKMITPNTQVRADNSNQVFTISDLKHIWVIANVFETDIPKIDIGKSVEVTTLSYPDKVFMGKIDKVYNVLDPENKTLKVRIKLDNDNYLLKPEMFANVKVDYKRDYKMVCIPSESIVFDKSKNFVLVYHHADSVETREVNISTAAGGQSFIKSGLQDGETVISRNALLIYNTLND